MLEDLIYLCCLFQIGFWICWLGNPLKWIEILVNLKEIPIAGLLFILPSPFMIVAGWISLKQINSKESLKVQKFWITLTNTIAVFAFYVLIFLSIAYSKDPASALGFMLLFPPFCFAFMGTALLNIIFVQ